MLLYFALLTIVPLTSATNTFLGCTWAANCVDANADKANPLIFLSTELQDPRYVLALCGASLLVPGDYELRDTAASCALVGNRPNTIAGRTDLVNDLLAYIATLTTTAAPTTTAATTTAGTGSTTTAGPTTTSATNTFNGCDWEAGCTDATADKTNPLIFISTTLQDDSYALALCGSNYRIRDKDENCALVAEGANTIDGRSELIAQLEAYENVRSIFDGLLGGASTVTMTSVLLLGTAAVILL
eukprot:TRINITY_DN4268_c0_g2_i1.p1 TRINITY_DN4268_c0_g2~~TRINITY_DN4268_c0_g2_i1.p1  ORF type:complete len:244 (-),score=35.99 TRINITY_DN4268_c0_g2_i1:12-743(-)